MSSASLGEDSLKERVVSVNLLKDRLLNSLQ